MIPSWSKVSSDIPTADPRRVTPISFGVGLAGAISGHTKGTGRRY